MCAKRLHNQNEKKTKHAGKKIGEQREKHKQQIEFVAAKLHRICAIQKQKSKAKAIILCSSFCRWPYTHGWYLNPWIVLSRTFNLFLWLFYSVVRSARSLAVLFVCLFVCPHCKSFADNISRFKMKILPYIILLLCIRICIFVRLYICILYCLLLCVTHSSASTDNNIERVINGWMDVHEQKKETKRNSENHCLFLKLLKYVVEHWQTKDPNFTQSHAETKERNKRTEQKISGTQKFRMASAAIGKPFRKEYDMQKKKKNNNNAHTHIVPAKDWIIDCKNS